MATWAERRRSYESRQRALLIGGLQQRDRRRAIELARDWHGLAKELQSASRFKARGYCLDQAQKILEAIQGLGSPDLVAEATAHLSKSERMRAQRFIDYLDAEIKKHD